MFRFRALGLIFCGLCCVAQAKYTDETVKVTRVIDGDTIEVVYQEEIESVRLYGIDCPEKGEVGFDQAKQYTESKILKSNNRVDLIFPKNLIKKRDHFGRLLAIIEVDVLYNDVDNKSNTMKLKESLNFLLVESRNAVLTDNMTFDKISNNKVMSIDELLNEGAVDSNKEANPISSINNSNNNNKLLLIVSLALIGIFVYLTRKFYIYLLLVLFQVLSTIIITIFALFRFIIIMVSNSSNGIMKSHNIKVLERKCFDICNEQHAVCNFSFDKKEVQNNIRLYIKENYSDLNVYLANSECDIYKEAYFIFIKVVGASIFVGNHFIYRGVLSNTGEHLFKMYKRVLKKMKKLEYITDEDINEYTSVVTNKFEYNG